MLKSPFKIFAICLFAAGVPVAASAQHHHGGLSAAAASFSELRPPPLMKGIGTALPQFKEAEKWK